MLSLLVAYISFFRLLILQLPMMAVLEAALCSLNQAAHNNHKLLYLKSIVAKEAKGQAMAGSRSDGDNGDNDFTFPQSQFPSSFQENDCIGADLDA
jgi:hypothetical protein